MRTITSFAVLVLMLGLLIFAKGQSTESYPVHPDSQPHDGVPKGEVLKFTFEKSRIFPGTWREYWVYVPAQYSPETPACVYVNQDGIQYEAPTVFDNLIHKKEMPVTIGVFVMHGRVKAAESNFALDRFNRSYEYDGLGDNYVRFLLEEMLPDVETRKTSDGRAIRLSKSGNDRAIGGSSSGAICAFTAAWERPGEFSRVFSAIGTYVGLRGGDHYPTLIRRCEPKPIRVFLQDGTNDLNIYGGDWWMANQTMERALVFAGYEVQHVWGEGSHNQKHATAVFPDAMRWLWKNWPEPVAAGHSKNQALSDILIPGEGWRLIGEGYGSVQGLTTSAKGELVFIDVRKGKAYKISPDGKVLPWDVPLGRATSTAFDSSGRILAIEASQRRIVVYDRGRAVPFITGIGGYELLVEQNGNVYVTEPPPSNSNEPSRIWLLKPNGNKNVVDTGLLGASGVALSPDHTLLYVADARSHWIYSYQIQPDGSLDAKQRFYWLEEPDSSEGSGAAGMQVDRDGRLYVATSAGIQICDQAGRVNAILSSPNGRASHLSFGGSNFDTLYIAAGDRIYSRKLKVIGAPSFLPPNKPAAPRL